MAETPKTIIDSEYKCFLCNAFTYSSRVKIFGKSRLDIPRLIESAVGENLGKYENSGSQMFICTKCYKRLLRLEKAKKNLEGIKEEICGIYQSINRRVKRQITDANVSENIAPHTTTKPSSAAKSLKFTESSTTATNDDFPTTCTSSDSGSAEVSENLLACMEIATVFGSRYKTNIWRSTAIINSSFLHTEDVEPKQGFYRKHHCQAFCKLPE